MIDLVPRTFLFSISIAKLISQLPYNIANRTCFNQLIRCGTSIGANYRATRRAKSNKDYINKLKIVEEEADETLYFLELLLALNENSQHLIYPVLNECTEILKIVVTSIKTCRDKLKRLPPNEILTPHPIRNS